MLPARADTILQDKRHLMGLVYFEEYKLKNLTTNALRITADVGVKSYAKFSFQILD